jgi:hypothetical protein
MENSQRKERKTKSQKVGPLIRVIHEQESAAHE